MNFEPIVWWALEHRMVKETKLSENVPAGCWSQAPHRDDNEPSNPTKTHEYVAPLPSPTHSMTKQNPFY